MNKLIGGAVDDLYVIFSEYYIGDMVNVTCFDFGPTVDELEGISKALRNIPLSVILGMEFFEEGWNAWGTKNEVKYFLPRLLEYLSQDIKLLEYLTYLSLIKYKLKNCLSVENLDWSDKEKNSLLNFFNALLECCLSTTTEINPLIECMLIIGMSPEVILSKWHIVDAEIHKKQVINLFNCFKFFYTDTKIKEKFQILLDLMLPKLTPEELVEIYWK